MGSSAPHTTRLTCAHPIAPAHMMHGSTVTYNVHSCKYLPPSVAAAAVRAYLGVGRRVGQGLDEVMAPSDHRTSGHDDRADGDLLLS